MPRVRIRPAGLTDAEGIASLILDLAERFILPGFSVEGRAQFRDSHDPESIASRIKDGFRYHVAELAGDLVGVVATRDGSHLYHLFVAESLQRQGLGRKLWQVALADILDSQRPALITVNASLNAVPFYQKFGFVVTDPIQDHGGVLSVPMRRVLAGARQGKGKTDPRY